MWINYSNSTQNVRNICVYEFNILTALSDTLLCVTYARTYENIIVQNEFRNVVKHYGNHIGITEKHGNTCERDTRVCSSMYLCVSVEYISILRTYFITDVFAESEIIFSLRGLPVRDIIIMIWLWKLLYLNQ